MRFTTAHLWLGGIYATCLVSGGWWLSQAWKFRGVEDWPSVEARIIDAGGGESRVPVQTHQGSRSWSFDGRYVAFEYEVQGRLYLSDLATPDGGGKPANPIFGGPPQRRAYYKPESPEVAVLVPTPYEGTGWLYAACFTGILCGVHLCTMVPGWWEWLRWRRAKRRRI